MRRSLMQAGTGVMMDSRTVNGDGTDTIELIGNVDAHVYAVNLSYKFTTRRILTV